MAKRREMRRRRVNSRQERWWTRNRGAAKVGRASHPEHPESVYTDWPPKGSKTWSTARQ